MKQGLASAFIALLAGSYIVVQLIRFFSDGYYTENPYVFTVTNTYVAQGIVIRDEQMIDKSVGDNILYVVSDGTKVLPNTAVAREYKTQEDRQLAQDMLDYEKKRLKLEGIEKGTGTADIQKIADEIVISLSDVADIKQASTLSGINDASLELLEALLKARVAVGGEAVQVSDYTPKKLSYSTYTAQGRGIFSSYSDGAEKDITPKLLENISFDKLDELLSVDYKKNSAIGKLINNINWYYVFETDYYNGRIFQSAGSLLMKFEDDSDSLIYGEVFKVVEDKENDRTLIVVSSRDITPKALANRTAQVSFAFPNYKGIRFSKEALRVLDGKQGVYTVGNSAIEFKTVDIIYTGENFYLSKQNYDVDSKQLSVFDEIIVRGKELYDGKALE